MPAKADSSALWLMLPPALLLTGLLVLGRGLILDSSLRVLDRETFRLGEAWSLRKHRVGPASLRPYHLTSKQSVRERAG